MLRIPGRTPVLMVDVPGTIDDCVLMYGHLDKQPEFTGWSDGLEPWTPVLRDGKLYGRGGADDGYALFASLTAINALRAQGVPHARCVVLIEASEESGSPDLPAHIDALGARLGHPSLVVCLDAECGNYEQLWCTTSLRGNLIGTLRVDVLREGVHSGTASGVVPSSFRVLRDVLARVEDVHSGAILVDELNTPIPADRRVQAEAAAAVLGATVSSQVPAGAGHAARVERPARTAAQQHLAPDAERDGRRGAARPSRAPATCCGPYTSLKLSFRLPPTMDPKVAAAALKRALEHDPPYGAQGHFKVESAMAGWNAPSFAPWLEQSMQRASQAFFGQRLHVHGHRRQHPVHGHARREIPRHAVPDHGRARAELERARAERVPAHRHRAESDRLRRAGARRSRRPGTDASWPLKPSRPRAAAIQPASSRTCRSCCASAVSEPSMRDASSSRARRSARVIRLGQGVDVQRVRVIELVGQAPAHPGHAPSW